MPTPVAPALGATAVCRVVGVHKHYGGVTALAGVDLEIHPGQVTAIVGQNGAGKSTLMKILAGAERADAGVLELRGQPVAFDSVRAANDAGLAIVFQELTLFGDLDVLANLFPYHQPRTRTGLVDRGAMRSRAQPALAAVGLDVRPDAPVASLSLGERQLVEIARALLSDAEVLILDEPNSALNAEETERLMRVVRSLRDRGVAVVYISHRLEEVFAIADVVTVIRNGAVVSSRRREDTSIPEVVADMIGEARTPQTPVAHGARRSGTGVRLSGVTVEGRVRDVDLTVEGGSIVGLAGLEGAGVETVLDVVFGIRSPDRGEVALDGGGAPRTIRDAVRRGVALVPADRRRAGLALDQSIAANVAHVRTGVLGRPGRLLDQGALAARAVQRCATLGVRHGGVRQPVSALSGGNQQKVVLAKWLEVDPRIVVLDDPTRGVDVGAKTDIYELVRGLAAEGRAVLFTSSELREYGLLCDRVVVLYQGAVCGELSGADLTEHRLLEALNTGVV